MNIKFNINLIMIQKFRNKIIIGLFTFFILLSCGQNTEYCPANHYISDLTSCYISYNSDKFVLIQHADLDINNYYFEIINKDISKSSFISMPDSIIQLAPQDFSAKLDSNSVIYIKFKKTNEDWKMHKGQKLMDHLF